MDNTQFTYKNINLINNNLVFIDYISDTKQYNLDDRNVIL